MALRTPRGLDIVVDPSRAEAAVWRRFRFEDDTSCRESLFNRYVTLARSVAARLFHRRRTARLDQGDFDQFAFEGLLHAIDRFDPLRGVPFSAYARRRIIGNVADGIGRMTEIDAQLSSRHRVEQERARSLAAAGDDPLAQLADLAVGLAIGLMLDGTGLFDAGGAPDNRPDPYDTLAWRETQAILASEIDRLPESEASVIRHHYGQGVAFAQIAQLMQLSRGRVSQLHRAALERLRRRMWKRT